MAINGGGLHIHAQYAANGDGWLDLNHWIVVASLCGWPHSVDTQKGSRADFDDNQQSCFEAMLPIRWACRPGRAIAGKPAAFSRRGGKGAAFTNRWLTSLWPVLQNRAFQNKRLMRPACIAAA
jgi:hypothetical protein